MGVGQLRAFVLTMVFFGTGLSHCNNPITRNYRFEGTPLKNGGLANICCTQLFSRGFWTLNGSKKKLDSNCLEI